ncbi:conjugal transfer protein MobA [Flavobacterium sp. UBA6031]|uniref:conjugal transfer protein MobA n=1 Tax=Flavobacterium sp. UBA6031 TaxID=1946551 RepID=UPI0025BEA551|nr:conjugal transfer protein MobA [Flavobacterium sp. UBA6031]
MNREEVKLTKKAKVGRNLKSDPAIFRHTISLNEEQNVAFLGRFDESGMKVKAHFITACIFEKTIRVVKLDKGVMDYYMRLTTFHSQFRAIGINYNQAVKSIKFAFEEKKALYYLAKLERATLELVVLNRKIIDLTEEFEVKIYGHADKEPSTINTNIQK